MNVSDLKREILLKDNILKNVDDILFNLKSNISWDESIKSRKTASFGTPYNYSNIIYNKIEIPSFLNDLIRIVRNLNGFEPNNCLINYYYENSSKMGFHSDQINILYHNTGISIFSFGSKRVLRFKNKNNNNLVYDFHLNNNSYFYMSQEVQKFWVHSILKDDSDIESERYSITFRKVSS